MWHKIRRLGALIAMPLGIAALVAVLLIQPWEEGDKATGSGIEFRLCNVAVKVPPQLDAYLVFDSQTPARSPLARVEWRPSLGEGAIGINAITGEAMQDTVKAEDRPMFDAVLASKRLEHSLPEFWPYSDRVQMSSIRQEDGIFRHRYPDPGAGIALIMHFPYGQPTELIVRNCRSIMTLTARPGGGVDINDSEVAPEDGAAFEKFAAEVEYVEDEVVETE